MKTTGIIGFIIMLLTDLALFFTSMNMPAGSKTATVFLIISLIVLILMIIYFVASIKGKRSLLLTASILLIVNSAASFLVSGKWHNEDVKQYGKYLNVDMSFKIFILLLVLSIIFGILGIIFSITEKKSK